MLRLPRKLERIFWKRRKSIASCHTKRFLTRYENMSGLSRSATPATRNEATRHVKTSKSDPCCRTCHRHGHSDLARTVANGCERLRNVERTHPQPPDPQSETGTLTTHLGTKHEYVVISYISLINPNVNQVIVQLRIYCLRAQNSLRN